MNVMNILIKKLSAGDILVTPVQRKEFTIENISPKGITLVLGTQWKTEIPANCWEGIPDFLKGKGWVVIESESCSERELILRISFIISPVIWILNQSCRSTVNKVRKNKWSSAQGTVPVIEVAPSLYC